MKMKWVLANGDASPGGMTKAPNAVLKEVQIVILGGKGDVGGLQFRDPECFRAGEIHRNLPMWEKVLENNPSRINIMQCMSSCHKDPSNTLALSGKVGG